LSDLPPAERTSNDSEPDSVEVDRRISPRSIINGGVDGDEHRKPVVLLNFRRRLRTKRTAYLASVFVVAFVLGSLAPLLENLFSFVLKIIDPL
jgi:hypothetical protein